VQIASNANGVPLDAPQFLPIFEVIAKAGKPILLHPSRTREMPDYPIEKVSKYEICSVLGWPYETGVTLARLVFSGIMDRFPELKVIAHHLGGVIPYLEGRVAHSFDQLGVRTSDEDYGALLKSLKKRPYDYFKDFYGDTAVEGARAATICGLDFFGADHVLFASDCPFDKEKVPGYIRDTIKVLNSLALSNAEREYLAGANEARRLDDVFRPHVVERTDLVVLAPASPVLELLRRFGDRLAADLDIHCHPLPLVAMNVPRRSEGRLRVRRQCGIIFRGRAQENRDP